MASVKRGGRRTSLTPEVHELIVQAVSAGNYLDDAAAYAGVTGTTVYNWLERGRRVRAILEEMGDYPPSERIFLEFLEAVETARSQAVVRNVALIQRAAETQWQAAAWYLERTNPRKWGRSETVTLTGEPEERETVPDAKATLAAKVAAIEAAAFQIVETTGSEVVDEPADGEPGTTVAVGT